MGPVARHRHGRVSSPGGSTLLVLARRQAQHTRLVIATALVITPQCPHHRDRQTPKTIVALVAVQFASRHFSADAADAQVRQGDWFFSRNFESLSATWCRAIFRLLFIRRLSDRLMILTSGNDGIFALFCIILDRSIVASFSYMYSSSVLYYIESCIFL